MALKLDIDWEPPGGTPAPSSQYLIIGFNGGNPVETDPLGAGIGHYDITPPGNAITCEIQRYAVYSGEPMQMAYIQYHIVKGELSDIKVKATCS